METHVRCRGPETAAAEPLCDRGYCISLKSIIVRAGTLEDNLVARQLVNEQPIGSMWHSRRLL